MHRRETDVPRATGDVTLDLVDKAMRYAAARTFKPDQVEASAPTRRFGYLDALRGIAILGVLAAHAVDSVQITGVLSQLGLAGVRGVQLFYLVSAFTLFLSLDQRKAEKFPLGNFFLRRFFRIAPLFYLAILASWLDKGAYGPLFPRPSNGDYLLGLVFLFGFKASAINSIVVGGWSVAVETTFYAVLPWLYRMVRGLRQSVVAYVAAAIVTAVLSFFLATRFTPLTNYFTLFWFPIELPVFLLGMVLYLFWKQRVVLPERNSRSARVPSLIALLAAVAVLAASHLLPVPRALGHVPADTLAVGLFALSITMHPWRPVVNAATRFLGKISYSMYLVHFWVIRLLLIANERLFGVGTTRFFGAPLGHGSAFVVFFLMMTAFTIPISIATWRFIEEPGIALGRRWIAARENRSTAASVFPSLVSEADTADAQF